MNKIKLLLYCFIITLLINCSESDFNPEYNFDKFILEVEKIIGEKQVSSQIKGINMVSFDTKLKHDEVKLITDDVANNMNLLQSGINDEEKFKKSMMAESWKEKNIQLLGITSYKVNEEVKIIVILSTNGTTNSLLIQEYNWGKVWESMEERIKSNKTVKQTD